MLFLMALAIATPDKWVPARWPSADAASLALLDGSPVNCLVSPDPSAAFIAAAHQRGIAVLREGAGEDRGVDGFVITAGDRPETAKPVIYLGERRQIRLDSADPVIGTWQGVWPGIEIAHGGNTSRPTGGAWIHTNTGVLRFLRSATKASVWIAKAPPADREVPGVNYLQAIADAATVGARWVVTLTPDAFARLLKRDVKALDDWKRINEHLRFYEDHAEWRAWHAWSQLILIQDLAGGGLITGNLLDMLAVMNTPVRAVQPRDLTAEKLRDAKVAVAVNPADYPAEQRSLVRQFADAGGKLVQGPDGWRMPAPQGSAITFNKEEYRQLEAIWPDLHISIMRRNFAARLFNVSGTLSYVQFAPDGKRALLQLVNYTDFPVESVTAFVQGKYKKAAFLAPGRAARTLTVYDAPEGTGVEIDLIETAGVVVLE